MKGLSVRLTSRMTSAARPALSVRAEDDGGERKAFADAYLRKGLEIGAGAEEPVDGDGA